MEELLRFSDIKAQPIVLEAPLKIIELKLLRAVLVHLHEKTS